ncbi:MAG TPA: glutamate formimidoyltransferase [Candidatus Hydrothermia bacterium]|nr:glutamate formimidoyltransferase [Candidatus Hydrothermia bacterium]
MKKIIECVPNFSEGRDSNVINAIAKIIEAISGVKLLGVDPGYAANRTVFTFAGEPEAVKIAAMRAIEKATELIDMTKHKGEHPRLGACDVVPFVPISGVTMDDCVKIAHEVGKWVAEELGVPVYMYEEAATKPERKSLPNIRKGEYEGLPEKLKDPEWHPDYGEPRFNPKSGAYVIGAREFLIAYNVNLNTKDKKLANNIAKRIRENGYGLKNEKGEKVQIPGLLSHVRAIGWYIDEYQIAQISINLLNYKKTPLWKVFETCEEEARKDGLRVTGSEIVGLVTKEAILDAGKHFLKKQGKNTGIPESEIIHIAVKSLGLNDVQKFEPEKKIIDFLIENPEESKLQNMTIRSFVDELSTDSPAPGGGSVSALCGALSAALTSMVANLTFGKKGYESVIEDMEIISTEAQELKDSLLRIIDEDTRAFNGVMSAISLPKNTPEEINIRDEAIEAANKEATLVPMRVMELSMNLVKLASEIAEKGNKNALSDAGCALIQAVSACQGAYYNVIMNLPGIKDETFKIQVINKAEEILNNVVSSSRSKLEEIEHTLKNKLD